MSVLVTPENETGVKEEAVSQLMQGGCVRFTPPGYVISYEW